MASNQLSWADPQNYLGNALGVPVTVTSGYRNPQHNAAVGGVAHSDHLTNSAYDFVPQGMSMADAAAKLKASGIPTTKIINENDHIHVSYPKGQMAQPALSDDDLLKSFVSGTAPKAASNSMGKPSPMSNLSDDQLLKSWAGSKPAQPASQQFPAGDSRNNPAAVTVRPDSQAQKPGMIADAIRSIPGGLAKGGAMIAGLPGDVTDTMDAGMNKLSGLIGGPQVSTRNALSPPNSDQVNKAVSEPFGGYYEPQTRAGKFADTIAQFAPAALAPGSAALRAARVVLPGAGSEAAGQATAGTSYEGAARFGGALAGAGALGAARNALLNPKEIVPSASELKAAARNQYDTAEKAGVIIKDSSIKDLGKDITDAVTNAGIDATLHPKALAAVKRITNTQSHVTLKGMDILRRVANGAAGSMDKDEARIAHIIVDKLDDFVENLGPDHVLAGDAPAASKALQDARGLWARSAKGSTIENLMERAKNRAETIGGSGYENALRVEFRQLAQNDKRLRRFSKPEQEAIRDVARGGKIENAARLLGKLAPTNSITMLGSLGAAAYNPATVAVPLAGMAGREAATAMTLNKARKASELVRRGGPKPPGKNVLAPELTSALLGRKSDGDSNATSNTLLNSFKESEQ